MRIIKPFWINHKGLALYSIDIQPDSSSQSIVRRLATSGTLDDSGCISIWDITHLFDRKASNAYDNMSTKSSIAARAEERLLIKPKTVDCKPQLSCSPSSALDYKEYRGSDNDAEMYDSGVKIDTTKLSINSNIKPAYNMLQDNSTLSLLSMVDHHKQKLALQSIHTRESVSIECRDNNKSEKPLDSAIIQQEQSIDFSSSSENKYSNKPNADVQNRISNSLDSKASLMKTKVSETISTSHLLCRIKQHLSCVNVVRWAPITGCILASGGDDSLVMLWKQESKSLEQHRKYSEYWRCVAILKGHTSDVLCLEWCKDETLIASCGVDCNIFIWAVNKELENGKLDWQRKAILKGHQSIVKGVCWDPINRFVASQSDDRTVRIWRTSDWKEDSCLSKPFECSDLYNHCLRLHWSPDGQYLLCPNAICNKVVPTAYLASRRNWNQSTTNFVGHSRAISTVRFPECLINTNNENSQEKKMQYKCLMATAGKDRSLAVWITGNRRPLFAIHDLFLSGVVDMSWSFHKSLTDATTILLTACSTDGSVAFLQFSQSDLPPNSTLVNGFDLEGMLASTYGICKIVNPSVDMHPPVETSSQIKVVNKMTKCDLIAENCNNELFTKSKDNDVMITREIKVKRRAKTDNNDSAAKSPLLTSEIIISSSSNPIGKKRLSKTIHSKSGNLQTSQASAKNDLLLQIDENITIQLSGMDLKHITNERYRFKAGVHIHCFHKAFGLLWRHNVAGLDMVVAWAFNDNFVIFVGNDGLAHLFNVSSGEKIIPAFLVPSNQTIIKILLSSNKFCTIHLHGSITRGFLFDINNPKLLFELVFPSNATNEFELTIDDQYPLAIKDAKNGRCMLYSANTRTWIVEELDSLIETSEFKNIKMI
ncbi:hypothetical protein GJ496_006674 [Pomphorhynchus laevis]|nr:hypothetical protein GJ496_006674 [Pomphorhynchus laevis]